MRAPRLCTSQVAWSSLLDAGAKTNAPTVCLYIAHPSPSSRVPHSYFLGARQKCHLPTFSAAALLRCILEALAQILLHMFFSIQVFFSLPMCDNAPPHTGCALQVLREMIKPLSTYCPFLVSMATLIKCFFSHISGMSFTFFPTP